ncbi:MAG: flagellar hook-basal body complex protein [Proteobacteria bacterium]|nr:flagellar hook-basal body complex protein [Pseudomonadota bacterium]
MNSGGSVYVLASRMIGQNKRMDMVADNVANANTHGFKRLTQDMKETIGGTPVHPAGSFTENKPVRIVFEDGTLERTDNMYDLALQGEGFFAVQDKASGQPKYSRLGSFQLDIGGNLTTVDGEQVLDINNAPINLPQDKTVSIARDGSISTEDGLLTRIGVYTFADPQKLVRAGNGVYYNDPATNPPQPVQNPQVFQGSLEGTNVNPILETAQMTAALRAYQSAVRAMTTIEDSETTAIRDLARIPQ